MGEYTCTYIPGFNIEERCHMGEYGTSDNRRGVIWESTHARIYIPGFNTEGVRGEVSYGRVHMHVYTRV